MQSRRAHGYLMVTTAIRQRTEQVPGFGGFVPPGCGQNYAALVSGDGSLYNYGVSGTRVCVRPAFWVNL